MNYLPTKKSSVAEVKTYPHVASQHERTKEKEQLQRLQQVQKITTADKSSASIGLKAAKTPAHAAAKANHKMAKKEHRQAKGKQFKSGIKKYVAKRKAKNAQKKFDKTQRKLEAARAASAGGGGGGGGGGGNTAVGGGGGADNGAGVGGSNEPDGINMSGQEGTMSTDNTFNGDGGGGGGMSSSGKDVSYYENKLARRKEKLDKHQAKHQKRKDKHTALKSETEQKKAVRQTHKQTLKAEKSKRVSENIGHSIVVYGKGHGYSPSGYYPSAPPAYRRPNVTIVSEPWRSEHHLGKREKLLRKLEFARQRGDMLKAARYEDKLLRLQDNHYHPHRY